MGKCCGRSIRLRLVRADWPGWTPSRCSCCGSARAAGGCSALRRRQHPPGTAEVPARRRGCHVPQRGATSADQGAQPARAGRRQHHVDHLARQRWLTGLVYSHLPLHGQHPDMGPSAGWHDGAADHAGAQSLRRSLQVGSPPLLLCAVQGGPAGPRTALPCCSASLRWLQPRQRQRCCRSLFVCKPLGLWCAAYSSGRIALRTLLALELSINAQWQAPAGQDQLPIVAFLQVAAPPCTRCSVRHSALSQVLAHVPAAPASAAHAAARCVAPAMAAQATPATAWRHRRHLAVRHLTCGHTRRQHQPTHMTCTARAAVSCTATRVTSAAAEVSSGSERTVRGSRLLQGERDTCFMVGGEIGLIAASGGGDLTLWPESDLRTAAESAGFAVPNRRLAKREAGRQRDEAAAATSLAQGAVVRVPVRSSASGCCPGVCAGQWADPACASWSTSVHCLWHACAAGSQACCPLASVLQDTAHSSSGCWDVAGFQPARPQLHLLATGLLQRHRLASGIAAEPSHATRRAAGCKTRNACGLGGWHT